jgi:hypothetical protein
VLAVRWYYSLSPGGDVEELLAEHSVQIHGLQTQRRP